jgi:hypothetical protein
MLLQAVTLTTTALLAACAPPAPAETVIDAAERAPMHAAAVDATERAAVVQPVVLAAAVNAPSDEAARVALEAQPMPAEVTCRVGNTKGPRYDAGCTPAASTAGVNSAVNSAANSAANRAANESADASTHEAVAQR